MVNKFRNNTALLEFIAKEKPSKVVIPIDAEYIEEFEMLPYYVTEVQYEGFKHTINKALIRQYPDISGNVFRRYKLNIDFILTTKCNLACNNCNVLSNFKETWFTYTKEHYDKFIANTIGKQCTVKLTGGEVTLLPELDDIILDLHSKGYHLILLTNGIKEYTPPIDIAIENSEKVKIEEVEFYPTLDAPVDSYSFTDKEYSEGCSVLRDCGISYYKGKFYPCTPGAAISVTRDLDSGVDSLEELEVKKFCTSTCRFCGLYLPWNKGIKKRETEQVLSTSWSNIKGLT